MKPETMFLSDSASYLSFSLISADFSEETAVVSTTEEIVFIFSETLSMRSACSCDEAEMSAIFFSTSAVSASTSPNDSETVWARRVPSFIALTVRSMRAVVLETDSAHFAERCPASFATTVRPFPASPTAAASIDAFIARM